MQEFKKGDLVQVKSADWNNWYKLGEVFKIRSYNPWLGRVFVKDVEGQYYKNFVPSVDNTNDRIWIDADKVTHVIDPEIEEFLINLEMVQKAVEGYKKKPEGFKVGDRVVISEGSHFYDEGDANPTCEGTVVSNNDHMEFLYLVDWDNGLLNSYREGDLESATQEPTEDSLNIIFEPEQIAQAAVFLSENNQYIDEPPEFFENEIYSTIKRRSGNCVYTGTLGFYALFSEEGNNVYVTVLVDPALGNDRKHVEATLKDGKLFQEF